MQSCPSEVRERHGGPIKKKRPTTRSESWGARVNGPSPTSAVQPQRRTFPPREEWHVRAKRWAQARQSRPYRVLGATLAPVAAERAVPRYQIFSPGAAHQRNVKRVELFPPDSLQWTPPLALALVRHYPFVALAAMHSGVACRAQRDQVLLCVGSRMAAEVPVVHLKIRHRATGLTPPAVATQDLLTQTFVRQGVQPQASSFGANHSQDAFSSKFTRKACCCSPGKNL
jgi:hypothetical protein